MLYVSMSVVFLRVCFFLPPSILKKATAVMSCPEEMSCSFFERASAEVAIFEEIPREFFCQKCFLFPDP